MEEMAAIPSFCSFSGSSCRFSIFLSHCTFRHSHYSPATFNVVKAHPSLSIGLTCRKLPTSMSQPSSATAAANLTDLPAGGDADALIIQYVVLRRDLIGTWTLGSVVTQGCHASVSAIWSHKDDP